MELKTQNGYLLEEVISALQKEVRRGNEEEAMYWALELIPRYEAYLWKRLTVIVNEDIGLAYASAIPIVETLKQQYFAFRDDGSNSALLCLANAILLLARSPKSRLADHFQCVVVQRRLAGKRMDIPDYALDKHTNRGRAMGRSWKHFREIGTLLAKEADVSQIWDPYEEQAWELWPQGKKLELPKRGKSKKPEQGELFDSKGGDA